MTFRTPEEIAELISRRWAAHRAEWLAAELAGEPLAAEFALQASRRDAASNIVGFTRLAARWRDVAASADGVELRTKAADWKELGIREVASHLLVHSLDSLAALSADPEGLSESCSRARARLCALREKGEEKLAQALLVEARTLFESPDEEYERLVAVVLWLAAHQPADCYIRQIPVEGVDTKWLESSRGLTARFLSAVTGRALSASDLLEVWGIRLPPVLVRMRHAHTVLEGLEPDELAALPESVLARACFDRVCIVENLQTGLSLEVPRNVPIVCGMGAAVKAIGRIPSLRGADILYAGDLDQHGLHILAQLRGVCRRVCSVLMDTETLGRYAPLAVPDPTARLEPPAEGLTADEFALYERLAEGRLRLEQERIPITEVNRAFARMLGKTPDQG